MRIGLFLFGFLLFWNIFTRNPAPVFTEVNGKLVPMQMPNFQNPYPQQQPMQQQYQQPYQQPYQQTPQQPAQYTPNYQQPGQYNLHSPSYPQNTYGQGYSQNQPSYGN